MSVVEFVELAFSCSLFANALFFVPQIIKLLKEKNSEGISLVTFIGFNIMQLCMAAHGYIVQDFKLMFGMLLSFVTCFIVVVLTIFYKYQK